MARTHRILVPVITSGLMLALSQIAGQGRAVDALRRAILSDHVAHSYIFSGPEGVGKSAAATAFFAALNCDRTPDCEPCEHCTKIESQTHPDLITIEPAGAGQIIAVDTIRDISSKMAYAPHEGGARMIIIEKADRMRVEASNALLKTLEEPPARTHFVLVTAAPDRLPVTVRSRCQLIRFAPVAHANVDDETFQRHDQLSQQILHAVRQTSFASVTEAANALAQNKEDIAATLDLVATFYRDVAACSVGLGQDKWTTQNRADEIVSEVARTQAPIVHAHRAQTVWRAQAALQHNANAQLTLEQMMLTLRE